MGKVVERREILALGGIEFPSTSVGVQDAAVAAMTSTATTIPADGVSILKPAGTTADKTFSLARPSITGQRKVLVCNTTGPRVTNVTVAGATASGFLGGSTYRTIVFSSSSTKIRAAELVALSTSQWGLISKSTGVTLG